MDNYEFMSINKFIDSFLEGRRKYIGIKIGGGSDFTMHKKYDSFKETSRKNLEILEKNPLAILDISDSDFSCFFAPGGFFPFIKAENTLFLSADLEDAILTGGSFYNANFKNCLLNGSDLSYSSLVEANLENAEMRQAILKHCDLRNVENLKKARELTNAHYNMTIVNKDEEKIISKKFNRKGFRLRKGMFVKENFLE